MKYLFLLIPFLLISPALLAQINSVSGRVIDADSKEHLPFVNIVINDGTRGGTTDIDGKFSLASPDSILSINLSYVGYEPQLFKVGNKNSGLIIRLKKTEYKLPEFIVYPTENPAHRIIRNAIANKSQNDPEKLPAFAYTSYDKMIFTMDLDSLPELDSISSDTSDESFREYFEKRHLFMMESVTERKFRAPNNNEEKVIATKISGLKDPIFVFLLSQWQSASFYNDRIELLGKNYINPISKGSPQKYFFLIQDTMYYGEKDTVFIISFRPRINTNFDGLKGVISINSRNWAIQNVRTEPARSSLGLGFRIEQLYEWVDDKQWFPVQLNTEFLTTVAFTDSSISLGMGGIPDTITAKNDSVGPKWKRISFGTGKSYIRNINLDTNFRTRDFTNIAVDVDPNAQFRDEDFWNLYRVDSLNEKEQNTYHYIDSLGKAEHFDRIARNLETVLTGKIPWGYFDLDLHRFISYNDFEGFAPGFGLHTNERVSRTFALGGYLRYGIKDNAFKYGGDFSLMINRRHDVQWRLSTMKDVMETGGVSFWDDDSRINNPDNFRKMLVTRMDQVLQYATNFEFQTLKYLDLNLGFSTTHKKLMGDYRYGVTNENPAVLYDEFDFTNLSLGMRFAYGEKYIQNIRKKISLGTKYPILWVQYTRGLQGVLNGDFEYNRFDLKITKSFYTNYFGETSLQLFAGYIDSDLPYSDLFNGRGSYRVFTLYAPGSFATMRMNEFLSNKYVSLFLVHDFGKLLTRDSFLNPEIALATNLGFSWLDFTENHYNLDYKTMELGYYESGLLLNNLIDIKVYSLGLGAFYRYGPYSLANGWDNLGAKLTLKFGF